MTAITGNTYPVKDQIKALGGKWDADRKAWMVPDDQADAAKALVSGAPAGRNGGNRGPKKCCVCGIVQQIDRRGYPNVKIYRSGECQDCYEERKMGY